MLNLTTHYPTFPGVSDTQLVDLKQDSATVLSGQSQPFQMVINEVVCRVQQGALTILNVGPLLGLMARSHYT